MRRPAEVGITRRLLPTYLSYESTAETITAKEKHRSPTLS
jgi:hypothetical protein